MLLCLLILAYDALCASRLSWLVILFAVSHQLNAWTLCLMQVFWMSSWSYKNDFSSRLKSIFNKSKAANSEIVKVELLNNNNNNTSICKAHNVSISAESEAPAVKRCCFPFVPDLYQVPKAQIQVQVQVPITPDQVQPKYWSRLIEFYNTETAKVLKRWRRWYGDRILTRLLHARFKGA